jgi:hypothetical protein
VLRIRIPIDFGRLDPYPHWDLEPEIQKLSTKNWKNEEIHVFEVLNVLF